MGHILTQDLIITDKKVKVVVNTLHQVMSQMHNFLGQGQFCAKFVPHFAMVTASILGPRKTRQDRLEMEVKTHVDVPTLGMQ